MSFGVNDYDNVLLQYYDGSGYNTITELSLNGEGVWLHYSDTIYNTGVDTQYFIDNFRIRIVGAGINMSSEYFWIDDIKLISP